MLNIPHVEVVTDVRQFVHARAFAMWAWSWGSVIIGFVPEAWLARFYVDTVIEPFSPVTAATAFILGLAFSGHLKNGQGASFAWVLD
jgi:hypothetical protein